jgi:hypothetical protein
MNDTEVFRRITAALDHAGIAYMLVGSFASSHYGETRSSLDVDIVIDATSEKLRVLEKRLLEDDYYVELDAALDAHQHESLFNVIDRLTGWKVDLILRKSSPFGQEAFRRRQRSVLYDVPLFVISAEDAIVSKLEWSKLGGSYRQLEDVAGILKLRWSSLDHSYLKNWIIQLGLESEWSKASQLAGISETM